MPQARPMRTWNSTPFAMGPKGNGGPNRKPRRRFPMGGVMPVQSPEPAEQVSTEPLSIPVQPMAFAAPDPAPGARVVCVESGPYLCYGASVQMGAGGVEAPKNGKPLALCACGRSSMKPFCDGSHAKGEPASEEPASEPAEVVELVAD